MVPTKPDLKKANETPKNPRMEAIYAKLQALKDFKDEIMDDLNDCMEDFDQRSEKPPQFDQVVDIAIEDSRAKAKEAVDREDEMVESS